MQYRWVDAILPAPEVAFTGHLLASLMPEMLAFAMGRVSIASSRYETG
jgi:hypothetical protein